MPRTPTTLRRASAAFLAGALAFALTTSARADQDQATTAEAAGPWYGWQTLLADGTAVGLWALAASFDDAKYTSGSLQTYESLSNVTLVLGFATYGLGAPAVHFLHGQTQEAWSSLALRVGLPLAGALIGGIVGGETCGHTADDEIPCPIVGGVLGGVAGGVGAIMIDAVVLAREPAGHSSEKRVQPVFVPAPGGGTFLLAGRF